MKRLVSAIIGALLISGVGSFVRADEKEALAVLDKAVKALGGEEKLAKANAISWKSKGTITIMGNDNEVSINATLAGLDRYRSDFEGKFGENDVKGVTVLNGTKGWRKFGDMDMEMDEDAIANEKRNIYLQSVPSTIVPLKGKDFKVESAADEKVGDKPAAVVKVTGPDKKDMKIYFDKESGLPLRVVATVIGFDNSEFTQEMNFSDYKEFDGIKKATKVSYKRDGEKFIDLEITEFKILDKVDAETFAQPK